MKVTREHALSLDAFLALTPALKRSNMSWRDIERIMRGEGWAIWNIGNTGWVFTMLNEDDEIEVLLAGGSRARECVGPWERAMRAEPAHKGKVMRVDGRKGWARLLPHWKRADGVLYQRIA
jgi:hypothetical protein